MPKATRKYDNEPFENIMRRFKRNVDKSGVLKDLAAHEFYEKPSATKKRAKAAAKKRTAKQLTMDSQKTLC